MKIKYINLTSYNKFKKIFLADLKNRNPPPPCDFSGVFNGLIFKPYFNYLWFESNLKNKLIYLIIN